MVDLSDIKKVRDRLTKDIEEVRDRLKTLQKKIVPTEIARLDKHVKRLLPREIARLDKDVKKLNNRMVELEAGKMEPILAVIQAGIKPVSFNLWRKYYKNLTFRQHAQIYGAWALVYPERQDHNYCLPAVLEAINIVTRKVKKNLKIFELGGYRGGLAYDVLTHHNEFVYTNYDFCYLAYARTYTRLKNKNYKAVLLKKPFWETDISECENFDLFITSHTLEHLINKDVFNVLTHVAGVPYMYIQMPIKSRGYPNVGAGHICSLTWRHIQEFLSKLGYEVVKSDCLDRWMARMGLRYSHYGEAVKLLRLTK